MGRERISCKRGFGVKVKDLGDLSGPLLLFGGVYSNLQAFEALKQEASRLGIPASQTICTGDVVAYCADAEDAVTTIRELGCAVIAGNCEKQIAAGAEDCGCGFEDDSQCSILARGWYAHALMQISEDNRRWMADLPDVAVFTLNGRRYAVIHGGFTNISRFIWSVSDEAVFAQEIAAIERLVGPVDGVISGHSGIAFVRKIADKIWINTGAIGMPSNDGSPDTRYVLLEDTTRVVRLKYNYQTAQSRMRSEGLIQGYDVALETGFWPSQDTLPPDLRRI